MTETADFGAEIVSETERYVERIEECVNAVPTLLDRYSTGTDYREVVDRVRRLEDECDRHNRRIAGLITNATVEDLGLWNSRVHLNSPHVVELYQELDRIPNAAERIAEEFATIEPAYAERYFRGFAEMAECAAAAMDALATAVTRFVRLLCAPSESGTIAEEVEAIRELESVCDGLRNDVIAAAFEEGSGRRALIYREFALRFDTLVDAMEDVTDQIALVSSTESWIAIEPERERRPPA